MLVDVDKLRHAPSFDVHDIEVFDGRGRRIQYMVSRDIISVLRDIFANPAFKDEMVYVPVKLWTSEYKRDQVFAEMWSALWWWREQVSSDRLGSVRIKLTV